MDWAEFGRKGKVFIGAEAGKDSGEIAVAMAFLMLAGVFSWLLFDASSSMVRGGLMALLVG